MPLHKPARQATSRMPSVRPCPVDHSSVGVPEILAEKSLPCLATGAVLAKAAGCFGRQGDVARFTALDLRMVTALALMGLFQVHHLAGLPCGLFRLV